MRGVLTVEEYSEWCRKEERESRVSEPHRPAPWDAILGDLDAKEAREVLLRAAERRLDTSRPWQTLETFELGLARFIVHAPLFDLESEQRRQQFRETAAQGTTREQVEGLAGRLEREARELESVALLARSSGHFTNQDGAPDPGRELVRAVDSMMEAAKVLRAYRPFDREKRFEEVFGSKHSRRPPVNEWILSLMSFVKGWTGNYHDRQIRNLLYVAFEKAGRRLPENEDWLRSLRRDAKPKHLRRA